MTESVRIYSALKRDIITCEVKPGASVSEAELCQRYSAGRTPVREACRRLHEEALMLIIPFRGYFIPPLTIAEYRSLQEAQLVIEPACAALAAERATPEEIRQIESLAEYEYYPGVKTSYCTFLDRNYYLHAEIASSSGNQLFREIVSNLQARLMRYFYLVISMDSYGRQLVDEHRAIVRAIRRRQPEAARQKTAEHLQKTIERSAKLNFGPVAIDSSIAEIFSSRLGEQTSSPGSARRSAVRTSRLRLARSEKPSFGEQRG